MKKFLSEFKQFALRGNVMDLAVGVMIGGALSAIVSSLVNDIISPLVGLLVRVDFSTLTFRVPKTAVEIAYGSFLMAVVNFLILAVVLFLFIRGMNRLAALKKKEEAPKGEAEPTVKACPFCLSEIPRKAVRCPHCTSVLEGEEAKDQVKAL